MHWIRYAVATALTLSAGCIPGDGNIVGNAPITAAAAVCTPACPATQRCVNNVCVGDGLFRFTLTWSQAGDMDLHVVTPAGGTINYMTRSGGGGTLDRDDTIGTGPENIFWTTAPPAGEYLVCVIPFNVPSSTSFVLDVRLPTGVTSQRAGNRAPDPTATTATCSRTSPFFVAAYTVGGPALTDGGVDE